MDDDAYPDFGNAYPVTQLDEASEAKTEEATIIQHDVSKAFQRHRRQKTQTEDDFFDRYPGPTPEKTRRPATEGELEHDISQERDEISASPSKPRHTQDEDIGGDDEGTTLHPHASVEEEADTLDAGDTESADTRVPNEPEHEPAAHYEHQGAVTELEEAIDESVQAPLIRDEEPLPTVATISREPTFTQEDDSQRIKSIERSFTANFTDIPTLQSAVSSSAEMPNDWPAVGDDKTFAELLDGKTISSQTDGAKGGTNDTEAKPDMSAAWAAALDDDEILDDPSNELDPTSFFGDDDDDGFLEDEEPEPAVQVPQRITQQRSVSAYVPGTAQTLTSGQPFGASQSPFLNQVHGRSGGTPDTGLYDVYSQPANVATQQSRPALSSTQSFVDKPKNGYASPYDLPMDVVKVRQRPARLAQTSQTSIPKPPPRTSSFGGMLPQEQIANPSPPGSSHGPSNTTQSVPSSAQPTPRSDAGFFADLPVTSKARVRPSGTYTPQSSGMPTPPAIQQQFNAGPMHAPPLRSSQSYAPSTSHQPSAPIGGLRQPEKAPLFPEQITPPSTMQSQMTPSPPSVPSQASNRYSPAPQATAQAGANTARYSPAPPGQSMKSTQRYASSPSTVPSLPPTRAGQSFVPRTSSPLAVHGRPQSQTGQSTEQLRTIPHLPGSPGKTFDAGLNNERRGSGASRYAPSSTGTNTESVAGDATAFSPRRTRTQSPSEFRKLSSLSQVPTTSMLTASNHLVSQPSGKMHLSHKRQFSRDLPYASPNDERAQDPLQRYQGHAIFYWSSAGMVTSSFPRQTPFYASGTAGPSVKCTPGDIKIADASTILQLSERDAKFPGPLTARSKGKKKELLAWLNGKIEELQQGVEAAKLNFDLPDNERRGAEEKLLLWQTMRVFLEHDGVLEGTPKIEQEIRQLFIPDLAEQGQIASLQSPTTTIVAGDAVDQAVLQQIRQALLEGQRERAVWLAEEKRLWGHAMLIASTMGPDAFKQIVGSFVRNQLKGQSSSQLKSLAALYQVFAGSPDECVDELVAPSARAGFQMINTADGRGTIDSLNGLDQWRETLSLVHSNPTPSNSASLLAIGKLLAGYGRIEAAHICYLFARSLAKHAGSDDPEAHFVLLGADAANGKVDLDSLMLTQVYEYASSLSSPSTAVHYIPHLQAYKLIHARYLAASGHKAQAQSYCEHIDAAIRATTRPSGYYHQAFASELNAFNALLSQSPHSGAHGGKFFSRPAIDKVSSNMGSWFTKFVSGGEDAETESNASGQGDGDTFGPFSGVSANSGPISRTPSSAELYSASMLSPPLTQSFQPSTSPSRYTPLSAGLANKYSPAGASQIAGPRASFDSDRPLGIQVPSSVPSGESVRSSSGRYAPISAGQSPALLAVQPSAISRRASNQSLASTGSYEPQPLLAEQDGFAYAPPVMSAPPAETEPNGIAHDDTPDPEYAAESASGYAPPTMGYEPPSYQPYQPEPDASEKTEEAAKPKKKSYMEDDDGDDIASRAAALKTQPASREPDPAIVAAAAADAARQGKGHGSRDSWFGGWFGGKKDPNAAPGPIKAKLGEESSFYFDKDLNKWVNKKGGAEGAAAAAPTPPPPRLPSGAGGPPSRAASGGAPPMGGPPSRQGTPANAPPGQGLPPKSMPLPTPAGAIAGSMAPPPRPSSTMSNASSLDDLLGAPAGAAKKGAAKNKKKGRYVDVMANAS
ncbi:hypothetical protein AMS68_007132 [Peltaster fructicola]|uniref:Protein transport protein sec16 n=1 Tax=Peltaster fructicola TaxID=286661 RepID=A0A6H0Y3W2_9PEZI|nr:hypothetical protein AMS68_007132 [Peltaster fructicola]